MSSLRALTNKYMNKIENSNREDKDKNVVYTILYAMTKLSKSELFLLDEIDIDESVFKNYVEQYISGIPIAYVLNSAYFLGRDYYVDNNVLIPRFETEEVTLKAIEIIKEHSIKSVCDIGCGSGVIAITLKLECDIDIDAVDISAEALSVAKKNAALHHANINFYLGSGLSPLKHNELEMVVSNPPYIPTDGYVSKVTHAVEPHLALFGGEDGMECYRTIFNSFEEFKKLKFIVLEIGFDQKEKIIDLANKYFKCNTEVFKDINGNNRIAVIQIYNY